jgi:hypothetical protein
MLGIRAGAGDFVEGAQEKAAETVEGGDAEGDGWTGRASVPSFYPRDLGAEASERLGTGGRQEHNRNIRPPFVRVESEISAR